MLTRIQQRDAMEGMEKENAEFAWSADQVRRAGYRAVDMIAQYLETLPKKPVFTPVSRERADAWLSSPLPENGVSVDEILDDVASEVMPHPFGNGHPRFAGWVNSPPAIAGVLAEALAASMNPSVAGGNHAAVWVERQVLDWVKGLIGFPPESMGLLVSGGSGAAITALAVARHRACLERGMDVRQSGLQERPIVDAGRFLVYKTAEGHACNQKAVELLGLGSHNIRIVPTDEALRMVPTVLEQMLARDIAAGHVPVAVIASAGTVNTGAIDPLDEIARVCAQQKVWLHVDAAYGGLAILSGDYAKELRALALADSLALDPHKWMYVPVDAGVVLVRDAALMRAAFSLIPSYLRTDDNLHGVQGPPWFSEYGAEQTRPFRALKIWMTLRYFGVEGYRRLVEQDIAHARHLAAIVEQSAEFELWKPTSLSIVCFRYIPSSLQGDDAIDALNRRILEAVQLGGKAFLSGTVLNNRFWLRACIVNPLTTRSDVGAMFEAVREAARSHAS